MSESSRRSLFRLSVSLFFYSLFAILLLPALPGGEAEARPRAKNQYFYVAPHGSDSNPGTREAPWRTLQHAADEVPRRGVVFVMKGKYKGFRIANRAQWRKAARREARQERREERRTRRESGIGETLGGSGAAAGAASASGNAAPAQGGDKEEGDGFISFIPDPGVQSYEVTVTPVSGGSDACIEVGDADKVSVSGMTLEGCGAGVVNEDGHNLNLRDIEVTGGTSIGCQVHADPENVYNCDGSPPESAPPVQVASGGSSGGSASATGSQPKSASSVQVASGGSSGGSASATGSQPESAPPVQVASGGSSSGGTSATGSQPKSSSFVPDLPTTTLPKPPGSVCSGSPKAFPTAEGFGANAKGGRGGRAIHVTNLNSSGPGSLRACIEASGPRTCIFRVGGVIDSAGQVYQIKNPYLTIAGQTAPGQGITLRRTEVQPNNTHDVIIRYLRARVDKVNPDHQDNSSGAFEVWHSHDIIFDHCSASWAQDDPTGVGGSSATTYNITYQWCIVAEQIGHIQPSGLYDPGKVSLVDYVGAHSGISYLHNLWTNAHYRAPWVKGGKIQMVNNVLHNIRVGSTFYPTQTGSAISGEWVKNYYSWGPHNSSGFQNDLSTYGCGDAFVYCPHANSSVIYALGNYHPTLRPNDAYPENSFIVHRSGSPIPFSSSPLGFPTIWSETSALQAKSDVLAKAGARIPYRDSADVRQVNDVLNLTGRQIRDVSEVGGYPTYSSGTPYPDADVDGMDDTWETQCGLNPNNGADGAQTAPNGYTNLENFLNKLADDPIPMGDCGGLGGTTPPPTSSFTCSKP